MARAACQGEGGTQVAGGASSEVGRCSLRGVRAAWSPEGWGADVSPDVGAHTPLRPAPAPTAGQGHARARSKCPTGSPPPVDSGALLTPFDSPYVLPDGGVPQAFRSPAHLPDSISGAPKGGGPREKAGSADYGGAPPASLAATASRVTLSSYHAMLRAFAAPRAGARHVARPRLLDVRGCGRARAAAQPGRRVPRDAAPSPSRSYEPLRTAVIVAPPLFGSEAALADHLARDHGLSLDYRSNKEACLRRSWG